MESVCIEACLSSRAVIEYGLNSRQIGTEHAGIRVQIMLFTSSGSRQPSSKVGSAGCSAMDPALQIHGGIREGS